MLLISIDMGLLFIAISMINLLGVLHMIDLFFMFIFPKEIVIKQQLLNTLLSLIFLLLFL